MLPRARLVPGLTLAFALAGLGCAQNVQAPEAEAQTVVLTVDEAPDWAKSGATVEVLDDKDEVLVRKPLGAEMPMLVDVEVPTSLERLHVSLRSDGKEAEADAIIREGYASCKLH